MAASKMKALAGHEVYPLTPEQLATWKKAVEPLNASWAEQVKKAGGDAAAIDADLKAMLKKHDAGVVRVAVIPGCVNSRSALATKSDADPESITPVRKYGFSVVQLHDVAHPSC